MRTYTVIAVGIRTPPMPAGDRNNAAVQVVCVALALALLVLAARIASIW